MDPILIDTTLRDGEQAPGVVFSITDKLQIATLLNSLGIDEVEAGTPAIGHDEQEAIRQIASSGFSFVTSAWCRANIEDIRQAAALGLGSVNISLPVSDIQIEALGKNRSWVLEELRKVVSFAVDHFPHVTMGAQDATRGEADFINEFIFHAFDCGARRIRVSDTVGISDTFEVCDQMKRLVETFPEIQFEFHGHNDLGLATANAIGALNAGSHCISGTINGLGERAGNSALEEVIAYLQYKKGITRFNSRLITTISELVAKLANRKLSEAKPLVGEKVFTHESGIHTSALLRNRNSYQFLDPTDFGHESMKFAFGKHSGGGALRQLFESRGIQIDPSTLVEFLNSLKQLVETLKRNLSEDEIIALFHQKDYCMCH